MRLYWIIFHFIGLWAVGQWVTVKGYGLPDFDCGVEIVTCPCGEMGTMVQVPMQRCLYFIGRSMCLPCQNYNKQEICRQFQHCSQCNGHSQGGCSSCPPNRHGYQCQHECQCENAGLCDFNGRCKCPPNYEGEHCQIQKLLCSIPQRPNQGHVEYTNRTQGSVAKFSCESQYILIGPASRTCLVNGMWSGVTPSCEYQCTVPEIQIDSHMSILPVIHNISHPDLEHNTKLIRGLHFRCENNYVLQGKEAIDCLPNGKWNGNIPTCARSCGEPPALRNGMYEKNGVVHGSRAQYVCNEPLKLEGDSEAVCFEGLWMSDYRECVRIVRCPYPSDIADGSREVDDNSYRLGSNLTYRCNAGFTLHGSPIRRCKENGQWDGQMPWCEHEEERNETMPQDTCPEPIPPANAYFPNRAFFPALYQGVRVQIQCNDKFILVGDTGSVCLESGQWSETTTRCVQKVSCPDPGKPNYSSRQEIIEQGEDWSYYPPGLQQPEGRFWLKTTLRFECQTPYYQLVGSRTRRCMRSGEWSGHQPTCIPVCGEIFSPRVSKIVGGGVAHQGQWPWQVALAHKNSTNQWFINCGASLLDENWIVTAAHCVTRKETGVPLALSEIKLYLGKYYRRNEKDDEFVKTYSISEIKVHEEFKPGTLDSDIALVRLNGTAQFSERIKPICLPTQHISDSNLQPGRFGFVIGWGQTRDHSYPPNLKMAAAKKIDTQECEAFYAKAGNPQKLTSNMFCAGTDDGSADACQGDSGGPLLFPHGQYPDERWYLEGIVSWGHGCGNEMLYGIYTKVINFVKWIHNNI
ncbi:hypothetical protein ScPMuIL_008824 [Solemya velum]